MNDYEVESLETDYTNRCGNCHEFLEKNDKFCRYCGTPRGEGSFAPFRNEVLCIYAPTATTRHKCQKCGYKWTVKTLGEDEAVYCPRCQGKLETEVKWE